MAGNREAEKAPVVQPVWNFIQKIIAPLFVAGIITGFTFMFGLGNRFGDINARIDRELAPIDGKPIRDNIIDLNHELSHAKGSMHQFVAKAERNDRDHHREIDEANKRIDKVNNQCEILNEKCAFYLEFRPGVPGS